MKLKKHFRVYGDMINKGYILRWKNYKICSYEESLLCVLGLLCLFLVSCNKTMYEENTEQLYGSWKETVPLELLDSEAVHTRGEKYVDRYMELRSDTIYEYVADIHIAKIPVTVQGNKIHVPYPEGVVSKQRDGEEYLAVLAVNPDGLLVNELGTVFAPTERDELEKASNAHIDPGYSACIRLCKATHRSLGVPEYLDAICCFWYPKPQPPR